MKQFRRLITTALIIGTMVSCTKEETVDVTTQINSEKSLLSFSSEKEMYDKILEIEAYKSAQEKMIAQKILVRNNLKTPTLNDAENTSKKEISDAEKAKVLEDVKFYHQEKLKAIYAERTRFGFTSIQSIADEINFLKLIDLNKSNQLFKSYKSFLTKNDLQTSTLYNQRVANLINSKGEVFLQNKEIAKNYLKIESLENVKAAKQTLKAGWLASGYNDFFVVTYSADADIFTRSYMIDIPKEQGGGSVLKTDAIWKPLTTLTSYVLSPTGYVMYSGYFFTNPFSTASYNDGNTTKNLTFGGGTGTYTRVEGEEVFFKIPTTMNVNVSGYVAGKFAVPLSGTPFFLWIEGTKNF